MMEFHREYKDPFTMESAPVNLIIDQQKSQSLPSVVYTCAQRARRKLEQCWFQAWRRKSVAQTMAPEHSLVHACETKKRKDRRVFSDSGRREGVHEQGGPCSGNGRLIGFFFFFLGRKLNPTRAPFCSLPVESFSLFPFHRLCRYF